MSKHIWSRAGTAGAIAAAFMLGSVTLGGAFAQTTSPTPPASPPASSGQQTQQPSYTGSIQAPPEQPD